MRRRLFVLTAGLALAGLVAAPSFAAPTPAKEATVTLTITGMT